MARETKGEPSKPPAPASRQSRPARNRGSPAESTIRRRMAAGLLAVLSAIGGAILESTTDVVRNEIKPLVQQSSCALKEMLKSNTAPNKFTAVVLPFDNDPKNKVKADLMAAMSEQYDINAIDSCATLEVPPSGDRAANVKTAQEKAFSIAQRYDADMLLFGWVGTKREDSMIIFFTRARMRDAFSNRLQGGVPFDATSVGKSVGGDDFAQRLIEVALDSADATGCFSPIIVFCANEPGPKVWRSWRNDAAGRANYFLRLKTMQARFVNSGAIYGKRMRLPFEALTATTAALGLNLAYDYNVYSIEDPKYGRLSMLRTVASVVRLGDTHTHTDGPNLNRAQVSLESAIACKDAGAALDAIEQFQIWVAAYSADSDEFRQRDEQLLAVLARLGIGKAIGVLKGLGHEDAKKPATLALLDAQIAELALLHQHTANLVEGPFAGPENARLRQRMIDQIDQDTTLLSKIATSNPPELSQLLELGKRGHLCLQ